MLSLDKIYHAAFMLKSVARKTDLIAAPHLSEGNNLYLKTENLQVTGSFKVRGAYYKISQLTPCGSVYCRNGTCRCAPQSVPAARQSPPSVFPASHHQHNKR